MKQASFYDAATGRFDGQQVLASSDAIKAMVPDGFIAIDGHYDPLTQRVDIATGEVVDYQPPAPSADYEWNKDAKRWQLTPAIAAKQAARTSALTLIGQLEAKGIRAMRELALSVPGAQDRLRSIDDQIAALRGDL
jgi:hypothetical protein